MVKLAKPKAADATAKAAMAERLIFEMAEGLAACFLVLVWDSTAGVSRGAVEPVEPAETAEKAEQAETVTSRVAGLSARLVVLVLVVLVPVVPVESRVTGGSELCLE